MLAGFPRELLSQSWNVRADYFQSYTLAHPRLVSARDSLVNALHEVPPNTLIVLLGPTGVGKSTLRAKIEQLLAAEMLSTLELDPGRLPSVSVECIAPESGSFSWRDHFRRLLLQMDEPLSTTKSIRLLLYVSAMVPQGLCLVPERLGRSTTTQLSVLWPLDGLRLC
ncbi:MAG TPA: AAA family ATPase [Edaphobacter sp.]|nr:AAA family ATPase [Edaphobacter sp.]